MPARRAKWSPPQLLLKGREGLELKDRPGVYRIRAFTKQGKPRCIRRAAGVDREGILHIGETKHLRQRVRMFRNAATGGKADHKAGKEFKKWGFKNLAPLEILRLDFYETDTKEDAQALEKRLFELYRKRLLDRPPLEATTGRRAAGPRAH